ncbi:phosphoserine aminotransferase [Holotrichia oblita]|nr:phosphoserine aminotransferase [Holotrichia oblita]
MGRVYNFSAGPAVLPLEVLETAAMQMADYKNTGMSVMEMSHRGKVYMEIIEEAEALLRELMDIPANYRILFLQGGASSQFAMIPLNLLTSSRRADYVNTGLWSKRAIAECKKYGEVNVVASSADKFDYIPELDASKFDKDADYFHITTNNTIYGTKISYLPDTGAVPIVTDMSSSILSEIVDVNRYGVIYAGAQKNIGPSGLTIVIIRDDMIKEPAQSTPTMLSYKVHAENGSMYNTPATYSVYIAMLVFRWLKSLGGVSQIEKINKEKASMLYDFLDDSTLFAPNIKAPHRSIMNVTFVLPSEELNVKFIKEAEKSGLVSLKGHRTAGGMRASIYNAMPVEGVSTLIEFMKKFETENK